MGSQGMVGRAVASHLTSQGLEMIGTQRRDRNEPAYLDAEADAETWEPLLAKIGDGYVVNCIGVLKNEIVEAESDSVLRAVCINATFPHRIAHAAARRGAKLIHVSTDGVFAGGRPAPYMEKEHPDCSDHYGRTKLLGECPADNALNLRCSIIGCDPFRRKGLLEWLLRQPDGGEISGYTDHAWNGVTALQVARLCAAICSGDSFDVLRRMSPVHHFCPNAPTTKYDLLCAWKDAIGKTITIHPVKSGNPAGSRLLGTQYAGLQTLYPRHQDWRQILEELAFTRLNDA